MLYLGVRCQIVKLGLEWEVLDDQYLFINSHHSTIAVFQVNGTLVTHSNHIEVVKLIKCKFLCLSSSKSRNLKINLKVKLTLCFDFSILAGSYVALTVLGRPPGLAQIPLSEAESEMLGVSISSPNSPAAERPYSPLDRFSSSQAPWVLKTAVTYVVLSLFLASTTLPSFSILLPHHHLGNFHLGYLCLSLPSKWPLNFVVDSLCFILSFKLV